MPDKIKLRDHLVLDSAHGTFDFRYRAQTPLRGASASAAYRDARGHARHITLAGHPVAYGLAENRVTISRSDGAVELIWNATLGEESYVWMEIVNRSREAIQADELHVLTLDARHGAQVMLDASPLAWRFFQNGWQSWSSAFVRAAEDGIYGDPATEEYRDKHQPHVVPPIPRTLSSEWFTVIASRSKTQAGSGSSAILLGFVSVADQLAEVRLQLEHDAFARLDAIAHADGVRVEPGGTLISERMLVAFDTQPNGLLDLYATRVGETMHARIPTQPLTGWCTWYCFYGQNTERDVLANLEQISAQRLPLHVILIDDGYQTADGDWTSVDTEKYPHGMKWLADEIRKAGLVPALWVAPFAASENSRLVREHPDFLLREGTHGTPVCAWRHWNQRCFSLDLSRAQVQDWLREAFRTLSDDWGYQVFKLDFLYTAAATGARHDPKMTRAHALRRGLEIIRETVGDKMLLACGAPLGPSIGIADALRIGPDVAIHWKPIFHGDLTEPSTAHAMRNTLARAFMHNRLWHNDPDCVLVRPRPGRRGSERREGESALVLNEMRTMVSIVGLSGGAVLSSDDLASVRRGRLKYLRQILPPTNRAARALDLFENELPHLFALPVETDWGKWLVVGAINWDDKTTRTEIPLQVLGLDPQREYHAYNYWHRRYVGVVRERVKIVRHQPHETRVLLFKPVSEQVELLTTTFHLAQGMCEVKRIERREELRAGKRGTQKSVAVLRIELKKRGIQRGDLVFAVPPSHRVIAARVNGRRSPHRVVDRGIVAVGLTLDERAVVEIETN